MVARLLKHYIMLYYIIYLFIYLYIYITLHYYGILQLALYIYTSIEARLRRASLLRRLGNGALATVLRRQRKQDWKCTKENEERQ